MTLATEQMGNLARPTYAATDFTILRRLNMLVIKWKLDGHDDPFAITGLSENETLKDTQTARDSRLHQLYEDLQSIPGVKGDEQRTPVAISRHEILLHLAPKADLDTIEQRALDLLTTYFAVVEAQFLGRTYTMFAVDPRPH